MLEEKIKDKKEGDKIIVFMNTKRGCDVLGAYLSDYLSEKMDANFQCVTMNGDRNQAQREEALRTFRSGKCPILLATNVAARGLDIKGVQLVINYDCPRSIEEYVHRLVTIFYRQFRIIFR